ncbi:MAG: hypothetical protein ITG02_11295 [Patulibacter sp.]|nr:hypothetical protein [Patulibacter sp.]
MNPLLAQVATKDAGSGAPIWQIAVVAGLSGLVTVATLALIFSFRRGGARPLGRAARATGRVVGVPGWAALPAMIALVGGAMALAGAEWDIALHIDEGRDDGPLGTAAHYPILFGLLILFVGGLLAVGLAPPEGPQASRAAIRIRGLWPIPASAAVMLVASATAFLAFPLDDLWHRVFGQDVTLWGPTHIMLIACAGLGTLSMILLLVEGARTIGVDTPRLRGVLGKLVPIPVLCAVIVLAVFTLEQDEFNFGVPQFRLVWHPVLIAVASSFAFVVARIWGGRGAALHAAVVAFVIFVPLTFFVSVVFGQTFHAQPLYLVTALAVEALAWRGTGRRPLAFGAATGVLAATVGLAAEYGWTHLLFRLPWTTNLLPEAVPAALLAAVAAGLLGALFAETITGANRRGPYPVALAALAGIVLIGVGAWAAQHDEVPAGATVEITVSDVRNEPTPGKSGVQPTGDVSVRFRGPDVTEDADWVRVLGWQGRGSFSNVFARQDDGTWRSTERVPVGGPWRTILNVNGRGTVLGAPVYMPADPAVGFAGFPLEATVTREIVPLEELAQIERKPDAPDWAWRPATWSVLGLNLLLAIGVGVAAVRIGRVRPEDDGEGPGGDPGTGLGTADVGPRETGERAVPA